MGHAKKKCPQCGLDLQRVHRHPADRLLGVMETAYRYRCVDSTCAWEGLIHHERRATSNKNRKLREWLILVTVAVVIAACVVYMINSAHQAPEQAPPIAAGQ